MAKPAVALGRMLEIIKALGNPRHIVILSVEDTNQLREELGEVGAHVREEERTIGDRPVKIDQYTDGGRVLQIVS